MRRVGVIGSGDVGKTLARGCQSHGYEVRIASRDGQKLQSFSDETGIASGTFDAVAAWADTIVLAVKGAGALDALDAAGAAHIAGKIVIDTTNPIAAAPPEDGVLRFFTGPNESLMERLQQAHPTAKFVKAFSCVGNQLMVDPKLATGTSAMFICGDDVAARQAVGHLVTEFGHELCDMGTAKAARAIEPLCILWCIPGFLHNDWTHAFAMVRGA
jgi:8-hydroxy-5-deazaflavin:NADPH oxidoreductase